MRKYLENYVKEMEKKQKTKISEKDLEEFRIKISFFQHERLIHLIVTLFFALFALIFLALGMVSYIFLPIFAILLIFLICYIYHYFFLENRVQYLYKIYDEMEKKVEE